MSRKLLSREVRRVSKLIEEEEFPFLSEQKALVIGVGLYEGQFNTLENAPRDARAVGAILRDEYEFELVSGAEALLDGQASLERIRSLISSSLRRASADTRWVFYFAGHGVVIEQEGYLLPADAVRGNQESYLELRWLLDECLKSECAEALIILDACYGGRALVRPEELSDLIGDGGKNNKVRQLITSGNPDQPVLDGGANGHSIFTQSLLEALEGWSGIYNEYGEVRFTRLLDHLVFDIPTRLRYLNLSAARQQPVGGNLVGNRRRRDVILESQSFRISPETVRDLYGEDPTQRRDALYRLVSESRDEPKKRSWAVKLAKLHLQAEASPTGPFVTASLRYEPVAEVRAAAATTLGQLADPSAVEALIAALKDVPQVCRAAAHALAQLGDQRAAQPLLTRLQTSDDGLLLDLVAAIGAIGDSEITVEALRESLRRGKVVPFVGPDFPEEWTGLPDRATVARQLAERRRLAPSLSLSDTAMATMGKGSSRYVFTDFMKRKLDQQFARPGKIHQALAELNAPFWISGAYDDLLCKALDANELVMGSDTESWIPNRTMVVRLAGDLTHIRGLLVIEKDYEQLRENEGERRLLISYLRQELEDKIVLFLGYDPNSPDFALLVKHVLNGHLANANIRPLLVSPESGPAYTWKDHPIQSIQQPALSLATLLAG